MAGTVRVLGDMAIEAGDRCLAIGPARQRCLFACLLVNANRLCPADQLIDWIWSGSRLPDRPRNALRTHVSLLRRGIASVDASIVGQHGGYLLSIDDDKVDVHRFRRLVVQAGGSTDDDLKAALLEEALGLWSGEAFATLDNPWINGVRRSLETERHAATLDLMDIQLRRGRHAAVLVRLSDLAGEHPLDERVCGQLMLALYRSGRQAEAIAHYQRTRQLLARELGVDCSPPLQRLYQQLLTADPDVAVPVATNARSPDPPWPVPQQLPARPRPFTGRTAQLIRLTELVRPASAHAGGAVIAAINGMGGIGKTWLALHWAYQCLERFPDGQLYVNLRGYDPTGEPLTPGDVVHGFLEALGVAAAAIPSSLEARTGLYRSLVAGRRMLVLLDNAADAAQVTPLMPGAWSCTVLVTSRRRLTGLIASHGAHVLDLHALTEAESRALLAGHLGPDRLAAEPRPVADLVEGCAGLPLALGVIAARAARHPDFPLADLAGEVRDHTSRLDAVYGGDPATNLHAVLSWSYHALPASARAGFGLLGLVPGPDIDVSAAACLLGSSTGQTRAVLRELEEASLLQQYVPGRLRMHDLIRLYAAERARLDLPDGTRHAALRRLVDFYLHSAAAAAHLMFPLRPHIQLDPPLPGTAPYQPRDAAAALSWLRTEHTNLLACQRSAAEQGWQTPVWQLAWVLDDFHLRRALFHDLFTAWSAGLAASSHLGDVAIRSLANRRLGDTCSRLNRHAEAGEHFQQALDLAAQAGDVFGQASTHQAIAGAWALQDDDRRALNHARQALHLFSTMSPPRGRKTPVQFDAASVLNGRARALCQVGWYAARQGHYAEARTHCQDALALCRELHDHAGEADTLDSLGYIAWRTNHFTEAVDRYREALDLYRRLGNARGEADTLDRIGQAHAALGQPAEASDAWTQALNLYQAQHRTADASRIRRHLRQSSTPRQQAG